MIEVTHILNGSNCKVMVFKCFHPGGISPSASHFLSLNVNKKVEHVLQAMCSDAQSALPLERTFPPICSMWRVEIAI